MKTLLLITSVSLLVTSFVKAEVFDPLVEGRVSSRERAGEIAKDLTAATPDRAGEIVLAIGRQNPLWVMTAAVEAVRVAPNMAHDILSSIGKLIPPELSDCAQAIILGQGSPKATRDH